MPRAILVVIDPRSTDAQPVVERAAWLAARAGASLELFACDYDADVDAGHVTTVWVPNPSPREQVLMKHRERLEAIAAPLRARGLEVTVDVAWEFPLGDAIVRKAAARSPWLVAKDTVHSNVLQRTLLSSTDWQLIRECPTPLLLVKPREIVEPPRVMVAVDPLHEHDKPAALDDALFRFGEALARAADGELHVVHAVTMPLALQLPPEAANLIVNEHQAAMKAFLRTHDVPTANVHVMQGLAHKCLQSAAAEHAVDFLVMGAVARRGLSKIFIGSTADRTLDKLPCDLVIIKPAHLFAPRNGE